MKLETKLPKKYDGKILDLPAFDKNGKITRRVKTGLENTLYLYSGLSRQYAEQTENNPENFKVEEVHVVGSCARENKVDSDLDFLLIAPNIDETSANAVRLIMSYVLFCDRPKKEAIDVFIRAFDKYPARDSLEITFQAKELLEKYNSELLQ